LLRSFKPDNYLEKGTPALNAEEWNKLATGPALLFVHGTTSTSQSGFASLPLDTLKHLHQVYDGRVFAFNHFTLSESPEQNATWFMEQIPPELSLNNIDIICHSRGGLVARMLAGELNPASRSRLVVRRIVFIGAPNNGTALANPENLTSFVDRYTTTLNLAPPGTIIGTVTDILEGIITIVKMIAHAALNGLGGLTVMNPNSAFMQRLNTSQTQCNTQYYAITSDYEPKGGLLDMARDGIIDRIFGNEKNDLLVPTDGVYKGSNARGFPIPDDNVLIFPASEGIGHSDYFQSVKTNTKLKEWLV
jgi:pimeloyl-ACP methyl ester carboxylesterase